MLEIFLKRNLAHRLAKPCVPRIGSESRVPDHLRQASARPDFVHARRYPRVFRLRQGAGNGSAPPDEMLMDRISALGTVYGLEFPRTFTALIESVSDRERRRLTARRSTRSSRYARQLSLHGKANRTNPGSMQARPRDCFVPPM
jgi:hypothetical protein